MKPKNTEKQKHTLSWLWRVTGKKKGYILTLTLIQGAARAMAEHKAARLRRNRFSNVANGRRSSGSEKRSVV